MHVKHDTSGADNDFEPWPYRRLTFNKSDILACSN